MKTLVSCAIRRGVGVALSAVAIAVLVHPAHASPLIVNGSFASTGNGQIGYNTTVAGWSTSGYNFVYSPGTADTTGATGSAGNVTLWAPADSSPAGGNFVALDADYETEAITTNVTGLTPGQEVTVSFYFAGSQQYPYIGSTQQLLEVSLGGMTEDTPTLTVPSGGFTGWSYESLSFDPTSSSEVLSFLADAPSGGPPFTLLSDVTVASAPEPGSFVLLASGILAIGFYGRRRNKQATGIPTV
jgi:hypothetical protein